MPSFESQIESWGKKALVRVDKIMRRVALDAYTGVLLMSPVLTGRFRGNWNVGINATDTTYSMVGPVRQSAGNTGAQPNSDERVYFNMQVSQMKPTNDNAIIISNNLPYAVELEYGYSPKAPDPPGIMRATFARVVLDLQTMMASIP